MSPRIRRICWQLGLTLAAFFLLSIPFRIWPLDLAVQSAAYDADRGGWFLGQFPPFQFIYKSGVMPALIFALLSIAVFVLSFRIPDVLPARKVAAYFVLCMLLGPGLLINAVFKEHWGRPRPRDVEPFGGQYVHERVWQYDASSPGKSFPCGHCSMGFYFFSLSIVVLAAGHRKTGLYIAGGAVVLGAFLGWARIVQGGHFLSDVMWSAGMCLLTSIGLFYALALDRSLRYEPKQAGEGRRIPVWVKLSAAALGLLGVLGVGLATPYDKQEAYELTLDSERKFELSLVLEGSGHLIVLSDMEPPRIETAGTGFGLPGSAIKSRSIKDIKENYFQLKQRYSGFFTELKQTSRVVLPTDQELYAKVIVESGSLILDLREVAAPQKWQLDVDPANLEVLKPEEGAPDLVIEMLQDSE